MIRIMLPYHLRTLARVDGEVQLAVQGAPSLRTVLDALEEKHPALRGTIRAHGMLIRRPFVRFYVCEEDWSHHPTDTLLPEVVANGKEPFLIMGAMAGG